MKAIIAINNKEVMGDSNAKYGLPWHCPEDLERFNELTTGCSCLVGWKTMELMPTLKGRNLIVDPHSHILPEETLQHIDWVIGGLSTFKKYMEYITEWHIHVIADDSDGDCSWPDIFQELHQAGFNVKSIERHDEYDEYILVHEDH